jgi:SAM-dependent methyltransferase
MYGKGHVPDAGPARAGSAFAVYTREPVSASRSLTRPMPDAGLPPAAAPLRRALDAARARFPRAYWRLRNGAALARWVGLRARDAVLPRGGSPYDAAFWEGRDRGDWEGFARLVVEAFAPRGVVDVGCGAGDALAGLRAVAPELPLLGLDSSGPALEHARALGLPVREADLARAARIELGDPFDVALCLEVAEHLPPWHAGSLVRLLATRRAVVFSAARPNQGGTLHVNEQPPEYWARRFRAAGMAPHPRSEALRRSVAALRLAPWYAANVQFFVRSE